MPELILAVAAFCTVLVLSIACYAYRYTFYMPTKREERLFPLPTGVNTEEERLYMTELVNDMTKVIWEEVEITSFDGLKLHGRYFHSKDGAPVHIQFHGYHGSGPRDFSGGNRLAREAGWNTLLITHRAHGKSEGNTLTFGVLERFDCLSWVQYVCDRFGDDVSIYLAGVSMGASTILMASELNLPHNVKGIVADSPYTSPKEIICKVCQDKKLPPSLTYPFVKLGAKIFGRFDVEASSPLEAVKHTEIPILLIHGQEDYFVPCYMSEQIYKACRSPKFIETIPNAGHGMGYVVDTSRYEEIIHTFASFCEKRR